MAQTLGIIEYVWNGASFDAEKGSKLTLGGYKQTPVVVQGKTHYAKEYEMSEVTVTTVFARGQKVGDIFLEGQFELQCNCDTGQSYTFADAFVTNRPALTAGEGGKQEVKFAGSAWTELLNG